MTSWQTPGVVVDLLLLVFRVASETESKRIIAGQWRAASLLCRLSVAWGDAVRAWRSLTGELALALLQPNRREHDASLVRVVACGCPALVHLDLSATRITADAELEALTRGCPRLQWLSLCRSEFVVSATGLRAIGQCRALAHLDLSNLSGSAGADLALALASPCRGSLTHLNLTGSGAWLTDDGVRALAASCASLRTLFLSTCSGLRDGGLCAVAAGCRQLRQCDTSNCRRVTDEGTAAVAALPLLEHFEMANCSGATDATLAALAQGPAAPRLRHLGLRGCAAVTEEGLSRLARACPSLTRLNVSKCAAATDAALAALATCCRELRMLDLSESDEFGEDGLCAVARGCTKLETLAVEGCGDALTDTAAVAIERGLKHLRRLFASGCDASCGALTHEGMRAIQRACPSEGLYGLEVC